MHACACYALQFQQAAPRASLKLLVDSGVFLSTGTYSNSTAEQWLRDDLPHVSDLDLTTRGGGAGGRGIYQVRQLGG
jgi:hypothetical protein